MKCYCLNSDKDILVVPYECAVPEEQLVNAVLSKWEIHTRHIFECVPRSDAGIDDRRSEDSKCALIKENVVFDGGKIVGYFVEPANGILFFDNFENGKLEKCIRDEYVGGWGDISEYNIYYLAPKDAYNEHSCRIEYIDPLLKLLGWDVANEKGLAPQYREVIAENYSTRTDRPDYTITLRGVPKFFVEAKKPAVDITRDADPAIQTRKYGWNAKHRLAVLTNFEYLAIYDTCHIAHEDDGCAVARYRLYHYTEYVEKIEEIVGLIARDTVYSGDFDAYLDANFPATGGQTQQVDTLFLSQINEWRVALSNELYAQGGRYASLEVLNDVVQEFINQIVFLRICEDKNLPLYHKLKDTITDDNQLQSKLEELFRSADRRYNSGMFSGEDIIFDLSCEVIKSMIEDLYYPQSPYLFNIIEPNLLGKIYEIFLTESALQICCRDRKKHLSLRFRD